MEISTIGLDLAKNVFQGHGVDPESKQYVVLLTDAAVSAPRVMAISCRSDDETTTPLPISGYHVHIARGSDWYAMIDLSGRGTHIGTPSTA